MPLRRHRFVALFTGLLPNALALVALAVGLALTPGAARADDPEPEVSDTDPESQGDVWDRLLQLQITLGLDTPFGVAGGAIELTPHRHITLYAGGGVTRAGGRFAGGLRVNFPLGNAAVGLLAGAGAGSLDWESDIPGGTVDRHWDLGFDIHTGITFEYRWDNGLLGRLAFGAQGIVDQAADTCSQSIGENEPTECAFPAATLSNPIYGWAGLTVGYALDL